MLKNLRRAQRREILKLKFKKRIKKISQIYTNDSIEYLKEKFPSKYYSFKNHNSWHRHSDVSKEYYETEHKKKYKYSTESKRNDINEYLNEQESIKRWEDFCGSCDYFPLSRYYNDNPDTKCPFENLFYSGKLNEDTEWKKINCKNFWN